MNSLRYASIRKMDISNGEGIGVSLFIQGCPFHCKGCFNQSTWDYQGGKLFTEEIKDKFIELCKKDYVNFISILGGEPLAQNDEFYWFLKRIKREVPNKPLYLWTGYKWENICNHDLAWDIVRECVDVLIDGQYEEDKKDFNLKLRGSSNQRIIDVKKSLKENKVILYHKE